MQGINDCVLRQYCPRHYLGGNLIYLVAKRNQRTSGQVLDSLMSAIGTAHACFIKHVLRRHQLIPVAVDGPPFTGK